MTTICICNVQLDYKDNLLETIVNLYDFYSLNLWKILSGGLVWSSHTVSYLTITDVTSFVLFLSCCTSQPKNLNKIINAPITKKITLARFAYLCLV